MFLLLLFVLVTFLIGPTLLVSWLSGLPFVGTLHWPVGGPPWCWWVSFVESLIPYELWVGERLIVEKAHPRYLTPCGPISVSVVPFGPR